MFDNENNGVKKRAPMERDVPPIIQNEGNGRDLGGCLVWSARV